MTGVETSPEVPGELEPRWRSTTSEFELELPSSLESWVAALGLWASVDEPTYRLVARCPLPVARCPLPVARCPLLRHRSRPRVVLPLLIAAARRTGRARLDIGEIHVPAGVAGGSGARTGRSPLLLPLLAGKDSVPQIASQLQVSVNTVRKQVATLRAKFHADTRAELIRKAIAYGAIL